MIFVCLRSENMAVRLKDSLYWREGENESHIAFSLVHRESNFCVHIEQQL